MTSATASEHSQNVSTPLEPESLAFPRYFSFSSMRSAEGQKARFHPADHRNDAHFEHRVVVHDQEENWTSYFHGQGLYAYQAVHPSNGVDVSSSFSLRPSRQPIAQVPLKNRDKVVRTLHELNSKAGANVESARFVGWSLSGSVISAQLQHVPSTPASWCGIILEVPVDKHPMARPGCTQFLCLLFELKLPEHAGNLNGWELGGSEIPYTV